MLITKKNFRYQKKYQYDGNDKYPRYILRGKKISQSDAEKIIITEHEASIFEYNKLIKSYSADKIEKPHSIREEKDYEESQKLIEGSSEDVNVSFDDDFPFENKQWYEPNTPVAYFVDAFGNVGATNNTLKYPMPFEFIVEHLEYATRYPFLSYVIIYADCDSASYDYSWINILFTPLYNNISLMLDHFTYALHVHDGGLEVVKKDEAIRLYKKYQKEYANDLIFDRKDYQEYVRDTFRLYDIPIILKNWKMEPELKREIKGTYKVEGQGSIIKNINAWIKRQNDSIDDKKYQKYKEMYCELEKIHSGKKSKLVTSQDLYDKIRNYLEVVFEYHKSMNRIADLEKSLKLLLPQNDFTTISDIVHKYRYERKSIELEYKEKRKNGRRNYSVLIDDYLYKRLLNMYDEIEHVRNGEETSLKYNKKTLYTLKKYLNEIVSEDGSEKEGKVLKQIWEMERELKTLMDDTTYKLMTDTILFTKSKTYNLEKEYRIYNDTRNLSISFMNDVKKSVKRKDFELKLIDDKAYIKKYNKLLKEYKKLVNTCLLFF